jgi:DNA-binding LacI/PurR family transcriptional regulator
MITGKNGPIPLYIQISNYLKSAIEKGLFKADEQIPSEMELAGRYQVNRLTARKAITTLVQEGLLYRVQGKGTFVAPGAQRGALAAAQPFISFVAPFLYDYYQMEIISGLETVLKSSGYRLVVCNSNHDPGEEARLLVEQQESGARGVVLFPTDTCGAETLASLQKTKFPFVLVDRFIDEVDCDYVVSDNFGGAYRVVNHLIEHGHSKIAFIYSRDNACSAVTDRLRGYRRALSDAKLEQEFIYDELPELGGIYRSNLTKQYLGLLSEYLKRNTVTAIFAQNDMIALEVIRVAKMLKLQVPRQLAVVGFDDMPYGVELPLTTVAQNRVEIGRQAGKVLLDKLEAAESEHHVLVPTKLIVRASCGCAAEPLRALAGIE